MGVVLTVAAGLLLAQGPEAPYSDWLRALADDDPAVRDEAASHLRAAGRAAWPLLERAARTHLDPDVRGRASDLLADARLRRRLSYRVLDDHPDAPGTLGAGATSEKLRLIRTLGRYFEEGSDLLLDLLRDPEPEIVVAAAEALHENRNPDWTGRLLELLADESCPRAGRVAEILASNASRLPPDDLGPLFGRAGPGGRRRLMALALQSNLPLAVTADDLRAMLREGDPAARRASLAWLRERGAPGLVGDVTPLLSHPEPAVVADALVTLRALRHPPPPGVLASLLRHEEPLIREEAVHAAAAFNELALLPALRERLADSSTTVRQAALSAIARLTDAGVLQDAMAVYLKDAGEQREQAERLLARHAAWALPRAREAARDPDPTRRLRALELLSRPEFEGPGALPRLASDGDEAVRRWALQRLSRAEEPAALDALKAAARDPSESLRFEALRTLVRRGRQEHAGELEAFLESPEYTVRYEAAESILENGGERAIPLACRFVSDPEAAFRRLALDVLYRRKDRGHVDQALRDLGDGDGRLRKSASQYLEQALAGGGDAAALARLTAALETLEDDGLAHAFNLVANCGNRSAAPAVRKLVLSGRAPSLDRAVRVLSEWDGEAPLATIATLLGDDAAVNDAVFARVRELRQKAPGLKSAELDAAVRRLLGHPERRLRRAATLAAEDLGGPADGLIFRVDDPEPSVRHAAIVACARLGLADAVGAIARHLDEEDPEVRAACVTALARLRPDWIPSLEKSVAHEDCAWARRRMESAVRAK